MPHDPVEQRLFKTDVMARLLTFDPFVPQNLLPFREELLVQERLPNELG